MKFQKMWDDALDSYVYTQIVENEFFKDDDDYVEINLNRRRPHNPLTDGWICPYCGKRVYSMEVHPCNQPWCGGKFMYEEEHPEDGPFCWNYGGKNGERS